MSHTKTSTAQRFADLLRQGRAHEIRLLEHTRDRDRKRVRSHYDHDLAGLLNSSEITVDVTNVTLALNPVTEVPRFDNGRPRQARATDIARICNIAIDIDASREESTGNQPSTAMENFDAIELGHLIVNDLRSKGINALLIANTGNGCLIIVRADISTEEIALVVGWINDIANQYRHIGKIDTSVTDLSRVIRLIGTRNCKPECDGYESYSRASELIEVYDDATTVTSDMLEQYRGVVAIASKPSKSTCNCSGPAKTMRVTLPFDDILKLYQSKVEAFGFKIIKVTKPSNEFEMLTGEYSFVITGCPVKGQSDSTTRIAIRDSIMRQKCFHEKCDGNTIWTLNAALGIKPSELSTLYSDKPTTRWHNLLSAMGKRVVSVAGNTMTLDTGEDLIITETGPVLVQLKDKTTTLDNWAPKHCHAIVRAAEAGIHEEHETATNPQRLAKAVAKVNSGAVVMGGWIFEFDGTGYRVVESEETWVGHWLRQVVEADVKHLSNWGFTPKVEAVTASTCTNCLIHLKNLLPQAKAFGTDLDGQRDLSRIVNYRNGIWLPKSGELIAHSPRYFVRPTIGIDFVETQNHPEFDNYLKGALPETEQQALAQELAGCIMAGDRSHQKAGYLFGAPRAGKGTYVAICQKLVGDGNYQGLDSDTLGYMFGLQDVIDKMLVVVNEAQDLSTKQVSRIKAATGNDDFTLPGKYRGSYRGKILCNWLLVSNNIIELPDSSGAVISRLQILDFNNSFIDREDLELSGKLGKELPAIAAWARVGYLRFIRNGKFTENQHSAGTRKQLTEASSVVAAFVAERCNKSRESEVDKQKLHNEFLLWAHEAGHDAITTHKFTPSLRSVLPSVRLTDKSPRKWIGISLK